MSVSTEHAMDQPLAPDTANGNRKKFLLGAAAILVVGIGLFISSLGRGVDVSSLKMNVVETGQIAFVIGGYGELQPRVRRVLSSPSNSTIEEVLLQAGARVAANQVIMRLSDPVLSASVADARSIRDKAQAAIVRQKLSFRTELAEKTLEVEDLRAQVQIGRIELEAVSKMVEVGTISRLEAQKKEMQVVALERKLTVWESSLETLQSVQGEQLNLLQHDYKNASTDFDRLSSLNERLTVRAEIPGTVQEVKGVSGQSITVGTPLVTIVNPESLYSQVNVAQNKAGAVAVGDEAIVKINEKEFAGKVFAIDPAIRDGSVSISIEFTSPLPNSARIGQALDARILSNSSAKSVYVRNVAGVGDWQKASVFVLDGKILRKRQVQFGARSDNAIEVVNGLAPGDKFAVAVDSEFEGLEEIPVKN